MISQSDDSINFNFSGLGTLPVHDIIQSYDIRCQISITSTQEAACDEQEPDEQVILGLDTGDGRETKIRQDRC